CEKLTNLILLTQTKYNLTMKVEFGIIV
ncbi:MAG: hypothetical protein RL208_495, partial [Pseudomonadota bacterium]